MRIQLRSLRRPRDEGAVAVIVAILSTILVLMAAFAVDLANAYAVKRQLSVAADAAALDAARAVATAESGGLPILGGGKGCSTWTSAQRSAAQSAAQTAANATNASNDLSGESTVDKVTVVCPVGDERVEVTVENSRDLPVFFGGVANATGYDPKRSATAAVTPSLAIGGLRPYAACNTVVDQASLQRDVTFTLDLDNKERVCPGTSPGNWGMVNFDGGPATAGEIEDWTRDGYPNPVFAPDDNLPGRTGYPSPGKLREEMDALLDQVVLFPVVTGFREPGSNAKYSLVGFVGARVCGYRFTNTVNGAASCYSPTEAAPFIADNVAFIQFRYVDYTTGYSGGGPTCKFSDEDCKYAILSAQLYK